MSPSQQYLNNEQCACVDRILQLNAEARDVIDKCQECGLDMDTMKQENDVMRTLVERIKSKFTPNRS